MILLCDVVFLVVGRGIPQESYFTVAIYSSEPIENLPPKHKQARRAKMLLLLFAFSTATKRSCARHELHQAKPFSKTNSSSDNCPGFGHGSLVPLPIATIGPITWSAGS